MEDPRGLGETNQAFSGEQTSPARKVQTLTLESAKVSRELFEKLDRYVAKEICFL